MFLILFHLNTLRVFGFLSLSQVTDVTLRGSIHDLPRGLLAPLSFKTVQEILPFVCEQIISVRRHLGLGACDAQAIHTREKNVESISVAISSTSDSYS